MLRTDIQALRAIAVLLVLLYHAGAPGFEGGFVGVDVFFVISGFLITTHLIEQYQRDGRISFRKFYARRALRLLPAGLTVIVLTTIALLLFVPRIFVPEELRAAAAAAAYLPNMYFAARGSDYLAGGSDSVFQQYWSLGVEEQFYLVWPLVMLLLMWVSRRRTRGLLAGAVLITVVSFVACLVVMQFSQPWAFFSLPTRAWELSTGGLVAIAVLRLPHARPRIGNALVGGGGVILALSAFLMDGSWAFPGPFAALPVVATALIIYGGSVASDGRLQQLMAARWLQQVGDHSYSLYLIHWPLLLIPTLAVGSELPLWARLALAACAFPLAALMFRLVEDPARRARSLSGRPLLAVTGALAIAVLIGGGALAARPVVAAAPLASSLSLPAVESPLRFPDASPFVPANMRPKLMQALDDNASVYSTPCHLSERETEFTPCEFGAVDAAETVVLFGDSHTANWFPALERLALSEGFRLESYSKSRCSSVEVPKTYDGRYYHECDTWRDAVTSHLEQADPDLIILSNYSPVGGEKTSYVDQDATAQTTWADAVRETVTALERTAEVVVLEDTPHQTNDPLECLARNLNSAAVCSTEISIGTDEALSAAEETAAVEAGADYVSMNDYLCNAEGCPTVIGDVLAYRDRHHLTATFSEQLAPVIQERILAPHIGEAR